MKKFAFLLLVTFAITGCRVFNPSLMFKTPKGYKYSELKDSISNLEYKISANDVIEMRLFSNDGFKLTDVTSATSQNSTTSLQINNQNIIPYTIDMDGYTKLPVIGRTLLKGFTIRQAEQMLEEKYSLYYIRPFIMIRVISKRAIIFPGAGGAGKIINLDYNNTTLIEGLALAGGITYDGKAYQIKLIRRTTDQPEVYHIDLSTIAGLKQANIILQANDIIYVEPRLKISQSIVNEISPIFTILSSILLIYSVYNISK